jgi:hypothetical protein
MTIKMIPVESSNIAAIGYDAASRQLVVDFKSGGRWAYAGLSAESFGEMRRAESVGSFFARNIKPNFPGVKIEL